MPPQTSATSPLPAVLLRAVQRLLRPLVRLLIRRGITFPVFADVVRSLYVEVALADLLTEQRARTDSRVSLMTGVHRKEVRRLRQRDPGADEPPPVLSQTSLIIALWLGTPAYQAADGGPAALPRQGGAVSFEALVESVTTDVRPRAVLDDLLSQAIVTLDDTDRVHLNTAAFIPRPGQEEQLFYFGRNLHDHIAAAAANVDAAGAAPFLDRSVHYDGLTAEAAQRLEALARETAQGALLTVNRAALAMLEGEATPPASAYRVNFGIYVYAEGETPAPRDPS